ncbi:MAG: ATP synthase F1 subunit delta [Nitrospinota bacterium]|nr:MAG: ATP synthase F1 subunit delta [Nitrospinota bacterium]
MISNVVARRYAQALVEVAQARGEDLDALGATLRNITQVIAGNRELSALLYNPSINLQFKRQMVSWLTEKLRLPPMLVNFLRLLLEKERLKYLPAICQVYEDLANTVRNRVKVTIRSAYPLSAELQEELRHRLSAYTGKEVILDVHIDPELLGGIVAQIGSVILDGSVRNQLRQLSTQMMRG